MADATQPRARATGPRRTHAVWEITLACNLACGHCGSRAGSPRPRELSTEEALDVVAQLAEVGIGEVTLIGGEAFLRKDWLILSRAITDAGMVCTMTTGGYGISPALARGIAQAGLWLVSVSVDGLADTHDRLRGRPGSWSRCMESLRNLREAGVRTGANTQINRLTAPELPALYRLLQQQGIRAWQVQMTVPMGNAVERAEILLQPAELLDVFPMLARIKERADREGVSLYPGNNVGYYGPFERKLRSYDGSWRPWTGCHAGLNTLGLEADGAIKGCPSLPTAAYTGGNIRERRLADILRHAPELNFNVEGSTDHLWGFCSTCDYARVCRGGCSWTAHVFFGRTGNNPYCHHRAWEQAARGIREELRLRTPARGLPFDHGVFEIVELPLHAPWDDPLHLEPALFHDHD